MLISATVFAQNVPENSILIWTFMRETRLNHDYPILESNLNQNYFACDLNCVFSRFNSTAIYLNLLST